MATRNSTGRRGRKPSRKPASPENREPPADVFHAATGLCNRLIALLPALRALQGEIDAVLKLARERKRSGGAR